MVWHDSKLGETLSMFKAEKSHMAIVRDVECEGEVSSSIQSACNLAVLTCASNFCRVTLSTK